jgi:hypothetical protein
MKSARAAVAGATVALALVPAMLAGCSGQPATPAAPTAPASSRVTTVPASPGATSVPAQTPVPGPTSPVTSGPAAPAPAPSTTVAASRVAYAWGWPNDVARPGQVTHAHPVPPVAELVQISVGYHHSEHGQPAYNRMSFTFTGAFPGYHFEWASQLVSDARGTVIPIAGTDVLKIVFDRAQAHSADGTRSTIISQPGRPLGYPAMTDYAQAGDFEGVLTYGIGYTRAVLHSNPQTPIRAYEVETVTAAGQHRYVVAIDVSAAQHG